MRSLAFGLLVAAVGLAGASVASPRVPNSLYDQAEPIGLPELLQTADGRRIASVREWESRRRELLDFFTRNVYGERPVERPDDLRFEPIGEEVELPGLPAVRKRVRIRFSGPRGPWQFEACAFVPKAASADRPAPAFLLICNRRLETFADIERKVKSAFFPVESLIARGYAAVVFRNTELAADDYPPTFAPDGTARIADPDFASGLHACWAEARTETSWGAISAWAWGASRVLDWLETVPSVDAARVAVVGHSRGGKTSLWAAASDSRFALACVNDSGCCGAKLNHVAVSMSETIQQDNHNNPHWFARSYRQFNGRDFVLPYDQHWIAALVAPRLLYIASASEDAGAGPWGEFLTARYASPAWALYGKRGLVEDHPYAIERPFAEGSVGYHLRRGGHGLEQYDWDRYLDFADRHLKGAD
ncbi:MAG: acetylxylan esterase [Kiritimatiellia bacterium]